MKPFEGYDTTAYAEMMPFISGHEGPGACVIGQWLIEKLNVCHDRQGFSCALSTVIDVGCGPGTYLIPFLEHGCTVHGVDAFPNGMCEVIAHVDYCKFADYFVQHDLRFPFDAPYARYDLCIFLETGEHIEPEYESIVLDSVTNTRADTILVSWAVPGQGGTCHFNERPVEWTLEEFRKRGYVLHPQHSEWRAFVQSLPDAYPGPNPPADAPAGIPGWLRNNSLLLGKV